MTPDHCPSCNAPLPDDAPAGLCPACVLRAAQDATAPLPDAPPVEEIQAAFPDLQVESVIGRGGMGIVYKAYQPHLDRHVALKILAPDLQSDPGFAERFAREARTLGKLNHPNIVAIHDFGETAGYFWLLMEYVEGVNLHQAMQAERFTPDQALAIIPEICAALGFAHSRGVLHRDIKPENILLDTAGHIKIADFGIALFVGDQAHSPLTRTGSTLGSAAYMAPEQLESPHDVDHRADIYSIGVIFYQMLTGNLPLGRFAAPSETSPADPRLDAVVFKALEREREHRFQSTSAVTASITAAHHGPPPSQPQAAAPEPRPDKFLHWSLGLFLGGAAGATVGLFTSPLLFGLGLAAFPFGLIGCLITLFRLGRGRVRVPTLSRNLIIGLALAPFVVAIPYLAFTGFLAIESEESRVGTSPGEQIGLLVLCLLMITAPVPLVRLLVHLFVPGLKPDSAAAKNKTWVFAASLVLLVIGIAIAKTEIVQRPLFEAYRVQSFHFYGNDTTPLPDPDRTLVQQAITEAAKPFAEHYRITLHPGVTPRQSPNPGPVYSLEFVQHNSIHGRQHVAEFIGSLERLLPDHITVREDPYRPPLPWEWANLAYISIAGFVLAPLAPLLTIFLTRRKTIAFIATATALTAVACLIGQHPWPSQFPPPIGDTPPPAEVPIDVEK